MNSTQTDIFSGILGQGWVSYLGIPYANASRWAAPQLLKPVSQIADNCPQVCLEIGPYCPQSISEDCLYLNVWMPDSQDKTIKYPVVVFVHGGSFKVGSGSLQATQGGPLAKQLNAIVVTFNYRLGPFGFFGGSNESLNLGLMDQKVAFDWIFENIRRFNGLSDRLLVIGHSAGALSTILLSEMMGFQRMMLMSPPFLEFRTQDQAKSDAGALFRALDCPVDNMGCMMQKSMRQILSATQDLEQALYLTLLPTIDQKIVSIHPKSIVQSTHFGQNASVVFGSVRNESQRLTNSIFPPISASTYKILVKSFFENGQEMLNRFPSIAMDDDHRDLFSQVQDYQLYYCPPNRSKSVHYLWEAPWMGGIQDPIGNPCGASKTCHSTDLNYLFNDPEDLALKQRADALRSMVQRQLSDAALTNLKFTSSGDPAVAWHPDWDCGDFDGSLISTESSQMVGLSSIWIYLAWACVVLPIGAQCMVFIFNRFKYGHLSTKISSKNGSIQNELMHSLGNLVQANPKPVNISIAKKYLNPKSQDKIFYAKTQLSSIPESEVKNMIAYVAQSDPPYYGLTPKETGKSATFMSQRVAYLIHLLDLDSCQDVVIPRSLESGGPSGGQMRRLSVAIGLLKSPSVLFLDEPTSGLDSKAAYDMIQVLVKLGSFGYTIIVSVHQPRTEIFHLFNQTLVLARGRLIYAGPPASCLCCLTLAMGLIDQQESSNAADVILDLAGTIAVDEIDQVRTKSAKWMHDRYVVPECNYQLERQVIQNAHWFSQTLTLNQRWWSVRPLTRKLTMMLATILATVFLSLMQRRDTVDLTGLMLQIKGLAIACVGLAALKNISISFDYYEDRDMFDFDLSNGSIRPFAFICHRILYETCTSSFEAGICALLAYWILNCNSSIAAARSVVLLMVIYYNCVVSLYTLIYSSRLGRPEARSVSFFMQALITVTSGLWIQKSDTFLYSILSFLQYMNPNYWVLSPMIQAILKQVGPCQQEYPDGSCAFHLGDAVFEQLRMDSIDTNHAIGILFVLWFGARFMQLALLLRDTAYFASPFHLVLRSKKQ
ncbi:Carboxylesterase family-domain-containing protein [Gorgonomyces haynaldii]|nr:Carboxylesterase family-domain-containing protein [Gorgonomyces haynaldii]